MPTDSNLRDLVDSLGDGVFVASPAGRYLDANPAGCQLMGCTLAEIRSMTLEEFLEPEELPRLQPTLSAMADGKIHRSVWRFRRKDGTVFVGELVGGQLPDGRYQSVVRDVTDGIEHSMREELLRHEATHRTKNILAVVQSIARQTRGESREEFLKIFERRIAALAATHDMVIAGSWGAIDLQTLIGAQLAVFAGRNSERVAITGPVVTINAEAAQSIGLAVHELATNAAKYGALSDENGRLDINWTVSDAGEDFVLEWVESGGPPVTKPARRGFGTRLVTDVTGRALKGECRLDYDPAGVVWSLTCPLRAIADRALA